MRPIRCLSILLISIFAFILLIKLDLWRAPEELEFQERAGSRIGTYFNWRTPSSLFPPSASISLTDDNSTFFAARPAAFGPFLPARSLSGPLWIGSGFGDDHLGRGNPGASAEGELGCSDVPGWHDGSYRSNLGGNRDARMVAEKMGTTDGRGKRSVGLEPMDKDDEKPETPTEDDGTDDHLHHPLPASDGVKTKVNAKSSWQKKTAHADIQSIQESAEIAGKIVLLSRGGCGFLEKVKWVQRRGGIALIVGDDIRGGQLVTMYARGDTSNVTIPSLFTSHTTAHLLSSLIPSGGYLEDIEDAARLGLEFSQQLNGANARKKRDKSVMKDARGPVAVHDDKASTRTTTSHMLDNDSGHKLRSEPERRHRAEHKSRSGWLHALFSSGLSTPSKDGERPSSGGKAGWVLQEDFEDDGPLLGNRPASAELFTTSSKLSSATNKEGSSDDFRIGVHDWRDPDLVAFKNDEIEESRSGAIASISKGNVPPRNWLSESIKPGNDKFRTKIYGAIDPANAQAAKSKQTTSERSHVGEYGSSRGWLDRLFSASVAENEVQAEAAGRTVGKDLLVDAPRLGATTERMRALAYNPQQSTNGQHLHDGLWVTLTPTSMSSSPFFDTLLVLVVSPLVTLTVVYALLLLRSRIRRRRWRAPKSVVERLPVRTYQTISSSSTSTSGCTTSSALSPSATTPLLPSASRPISAQPRPRTRAQTVAYVSRGPSSLPLASPSPEDIEEERAAGLAEWRRRYGGRQRECVVCLEEYVDGVSRVMSLPCGHEFHAECITPWLTTRRRTCPICKGDVVRSLARSANSTASPTSSLPLPLNGDLEDGIGREDAIQIQAALTINEDPTSQLPLSREEEAFEDLESGMGVVGNDDGRDHGRER